MNAIETIDLLHRIGEHALAHDLERMRLAVLEVLGSAHPEKWNGPGDPTIVLWAA
jgi:hypothetical protein